MPTETPPLKRTPAKTNSTEPPARQLAGFISKFDPAIAKLVRATRPILRQRFFPTAVELVYDNYNALAIGWAGTERTSDVILSLAVYPRGASLYFMHGKKLPDPQGLLKGGGNQGGFVRLESRSALDQPAVQALIRAAIRQSKTALPQSGRGYTVIKSVSATQRPRRPNGQ